MRYIIDRFEGEFALVELSDHSHIKLPRILVPKEAKEGDILSIVIDQEATETRKKSIGLMMSDLFED